MMESLRKDDRRCRSKAEISARALLHPALAMGVGGGGGEKFFVLRRVSAVMRV